jgi:hypothetical protein
MKSLAVHKRCRRMNESASIVYFFLTHDHRRKSVN